MTSHLDTLHIPGGGALPGRTVNIAAQIAIDLKWLNMARIAALDGIGMQYNPASFVAAILRLVVHLPGERGELPETQIVAALIYHTSKIVLTGASNEYGTRTAAWMFVSLLRQRLKIPAIVYNFTVENIVCNYYLQFKVDLVRFAKREGKLCKYFPDRFPAVVYKFGEKFAALVNKTGRVIVTGSRSRDISLSSYKMLREKLLAYSVQEPTDSTVAHIGMPEPSEQMRNLMDRHDSYMKMTSLVEQLVTSFTSFDLERIDETAPEMGVMTALRDYDTLRPLPSALALSGDGKHTRKRKKNSK